MGNRGCKTVVPREQGTSLAHALHVYLVADTDAA